MQHLAIIPDGNRRWAIKHKLQTLMGHKKGLHAFKIAIEFCLKNNVNYLSFYTFSLENFNRSETEKNYLFNLFIEEFSTQLPKLIEQGVRVRFLGDEKYFPKQVIPFIKKAEQQTQSLKKLNLNILFCYGSQNEIINAVKKITKKVQAGLLAIEDIDEKQLNKHLLTSGMPDPDLIIRTSGFSRLSNFLLYQSAYSELMFLDCLWPEVTLNHLDRCLQDFKNIKRNFGG